jgi:pilus assembly protein Flp/PilA
MSPSQLRREKGMSNQFLCFSLRRVYESSLKRSGHRELEAFKTSTARSHVEWEPKMKKLFSKIRNNESGATAIEYGLIAALIAVVLITSLGTLGNNMGSRFNQVANSVGTSR